MKTSDTTKALWPAFLAAQKALLPARKDSVNPHLKNKYADLAAVWEACEGALSAAGLIVVQSPATQRDVGVVLTTRIVHAESGEWLESELGMPASKGDAQSIGSAITYARRYALTSLLGIVAEDDDGEAAKGRGRSEQARNGSGPAAPSGEAIASVAEKIRAAAKSGDVARAEHGFRTYLGKGSGVPEDLRRSVWADIEAAKKAAPQNGARP